MSQRTRKVVKLLRLRRSEMEKAPNLCQIVTNTNTHTNTNTNTESLSSEMEKAPSLC